VILSTEEWLSMHFKIMSDAGQVLATGALLVRPAADGRLKLWLLTSRGTLLEGGAVADDGDLTEAGKVLLSACRRHWGVAGIAIRGVQSPMD
jgi:hypothetical protein